MHVIDHKGGIGFNKGLARRVHDHLIVLQRVARIAHALAVLRLGDERRKGRITSVEWAISLDCRESGILDAIMEVRKCRGEERKGNRISRIM